MRIKMAQSSKKVGLDQISPLVPPHVSLLYPASSKGSPKTLVVAHPQIFVARTKIQLQKIPPGELGYSHLAQKNWGTWNQRS